MAPFHKQCVFEGCAEHPLHGYQASKNVPMKWACPEHKHLLQREAPAPAALTKKADLFSQ